MKKLKKSFKNREEVEKYFKNDVFKFVFISDNAMHFESLNPHWVGEKLYSFELEFYFNEGREFFCYSSFADWFKYHQLSRVIMISEETKERTELFFAMYDENLDN